VIEQTIIRDDRNLFYYILAIVTVWLLVIVVLFLANFDIKDILTRFREGPILVGGALFILAYRGYGIYSALTSDKEQIVLENNKIKQSASNREIDISNIGEVYLCSNSGMTNKFMRLTIAKKLLFTIIFPVALFWTPYGSIVKYLTKYIISLIREGGFEWRWYHLLVVIPKDNDNAVIITLDSQNITVIEQYLKSTLQLSMSDIHKCFMPPSKKQQSLQ
jgi:hypothetical protein